MQAAQLFLHQRRSVFHKFIEFEARISISNSDIIAITEVKPKNPRYSNFQKAFDKVPHDILISKIKNYGAHKSLSYWIHVYPENRTQCIAVCQSRIKPQQTTQSYPQFPRALFYTLFIWRVCQ